MRIYRIYKCMGFMMCEWMSIRLETCACRMPSWVVLFGIAVLVSVLALCFAWTQSQAWQMTALRSGEDHARSSGVAVERLRLVSLLRVYLLSATALAFVGTIGFVGLVGPHIARLVLGEDHRFYLPASALAGAVMLSGASILSKIIVPGAPLPACPPCRARLGWTVKTSGD